MKITNLDKKVLTLDKKDIPFAEDGSPMTIGKVVGTIIATSQTKSFDNLKGFIVGSKFYDNKEVDIDEADYAIVMKIIKENANFTPIILGQIEMELTAQREALEKKK